MLMRIRAIPIWFFANRVQLLTTEKRRRYACTKENTRWAKGGNVTGMYFWFLCLDEYIIDSLLYLELTYYNMTQSLSFI